METKVIIQKFICVNHKNPRFDSLRLVETRRALNQRSIFQRNNYFCPHSKLIHTTGFDRKNSFIKTETMKNLNKRLNSAGNGLGDIYIMDYSAFEKIIERIKP